MLAWVLIGVLLGAAGLAVLTALTVRLYLQVRQFGRDVSAAGARIGAITEELQRTAPPR